MKEEGFVSILGGGNSCVTPICCVLPVVMEQLGSLKFLYYHQNSMHDKSVFKNTFYCFKTLKMVEC